MRRIFLAILILGGAITAYVEMASRKGTPVAT